MKHHILTEKGTKESILNAYAVIAQENESLFKKVMEDDPFVINIKNFGLIIDCTSKITFNPLEYNKCASKLYDSFNSIPDEEWYDC